MTPLNVDVEPDEAGFVTVTIGCEGSSTGAGDVGN